MPDVTSTLLAMYQQIIGGSSAREQSSLEAECARRVILSNLTITPLGQVLVPSLVVGALTVSPGPFTVTGNVTVNGTLAVTGSATVGGLLTANGGLTVNNGPLTSNGDCVVSGLFSVLSVGAHRIDAAGAGVQTLTIRNSLAGSGNNARLVVGNDTSAVLTILQSNNSLTPAVNFNLPNGSTLVGTGAGGLSLATSDAAGILRFYTGAAGAERMRINSGGFFTMNLATALNAQYSMGFDGTVTAAGIGVENLNAGNAGAFLQCFNSTGAAIGQIGQASATSVVYQTTSDARLKTDQGLVSDVSALRRLRVHDFLWTADGVPDRGVFAQEAQPLYPRAVSMGTDETTATGALARPWMTDYSKFVPDLIVGWQQHDAELAALRALLGRRVA